MSFSRQVSLVVPQYKSPRLTIQQQKPLNSRKKLELSSFKQRGDVIRSSLSETTQVKQHDKEPQQHEQMKEQQKDRLTLLHSRLQQEAEKIRKWRTATELELNQKEQKLKEAQLRIDKQQKLISDIQLENESLNARIKDELANQEELQRKINSTREMCNALKEHTLNIEQSIVRGEEDRVVLKERNQSVLEQYNELVEKFNQLELVQSESHALFEAQIFEERKSNEELAVELGKVIKDSQDKLKALEHELSLSKTEHERMSDDLETKTALIQSLTDEKGSLEEGLLSKDSQILSIQSELDSCNRVVTQKEEEITRLVGELSLKVEEADTICKKNQELEEKLVGMEAEYSLSMRKLEQEREKLKNTLVDTEESLRHTHLNLTASEENQLMLSKKCMELESVLERAKEENYELSVKLGNSQEQLDRVSKDLESAQHELVTHSGQLSEAQQLLMQKEEEKENLDVHLNKALEEEKNNVFLLQEELKRTVTVQNRLGEEKIELTEKLFAIEKDKQSLEIQKNELTEKLSAMEKDKQSLEIQIESVTSSLNSVTQKMDTETLKLKEKADEALLECTKLQSTVVQLKAEVNQKDQSIEEMKEKNQLLETEISAKDKKLSSVVSELESERQILSSLCQEKAQADADLKEQASSHSSELFSLKAELSRIQGELRDGATREDELRRMMDAQASEMGVTLEKYKAENTHIVSLKDIEIDSLKQQMTMEKERLQARLKELGETMEAQSSELENRGKKVRGLERQLKEKEEELTQLITAANTLQVVQNTPVAHKTPPHVVNHIQYHTPMETSGLKSLSRKSKLTSPSRTVPFSPHVSSTPRNTRPKPFSTGRTPLTAGRVQLKSLEEKINRQEDSPDTHPIKEDEAIFKKPKKQLLMTPKKSTPKCLARGNRKKSIRQKPVTKDQGGDHQLDKLSWFDLDPVFGFPPED